MQSKDVGTFTVVVVTAGLLFAAACGWIMNIVTLLHGGDAMGTWELVLRIGGVFMAPVGAVLGYF